MATFQHTEQVTNILRTFPGETVAYPELYDSCLEKACVHVSEMPYTIRPNTEACLWAFELLEIQNLGFYNPVLHWLLTSNCFLFISFFGFLNRPGVEFLATFFNLLFIIHDYYQKRLIFGVGRGIYFSIGLHNGSRQCSYQVYSMFPFPDRCL